jgi:hypothetical protein
MTDLSRMTNEQLLAAYQAAKGGAAPAKPKTLSAQEQIALRKAREAASGADEAARTAEQFVDINRRQNTGGLWAIPGIGKLAGPFDSDISQLNALTARMAPQQRVPGSGETSNKDLSLFLQAVPGLDKPGPANSAIARQARADAARRQEYAVFLDRWASERGTLAGAEQAWLQSQSRPRPAAPPRKPAPAEPAAPSKRYRILSVE